MFTTGELEFDCESDAWIDWDEDCQGPMDTREHEIEYPHGFMWTCCEKSGDEEGCNVGRHKTGTMRARKDQIVPMPASTKDRKGSKAGTKPPLGATTTAKASAGTKRLRSRYAKCVNCDQEFDATSNEPGDCLWHEGNPPVFLLPSTTAPFSYHAALGLPHVGH